MSRIRVKPVRTFMLRALLACGVGILGCTDDSAEMFNCYLAPDVPPILIKGESVSEASKKCEKEQGQACTCSAVQSYRGIVAPN